MEDDKIYLMNRFKSRIQRMSSRPKFFSNPRYRIISYHQNILAIKTYYRSCLGIKDFAEEIHFP
jgi:hypothetical protein